MANTNGVVSPLLKINCSKNKFFKRFHVYLTGGMRGETFQTQYINGVVDRTWTKSAREIHLLLGKESLEDDGYGMSEVFSGGESKWLLNIQILPVYPILRP